VCGNCTCLRGCQQQLEQQIAPRPLLRALVGARALERLLFPTGWRSPGHGERERPLHTHTHTHRCRRQLARRASPAAPQSRLHCRPRHPRGALPAKLNPWAKSAPQKDILSPVRRAPHRSKCQSCKETIDKDTQRVSFPGRHAGITCVRWLHPQCFADECIAVDYAPTSRAKCADSGREISKGEARLVMRLLGCDGQPKGAKIFHPASSKATTFLRELIDCTDGVSHASLASRLDGPEEHRTWVAKALAGQVPTTPTPMSASEPKPKKRKPTAKEETEEAEAADSTAEPKRQRQRQPKKAAKKAAAAPAGPSVDADESSDGEMMD
jgi:hypothetical protein